MSAERRVRFTGIGVVSPLGQDRELSWQRLIAGQRALRWLTDEESAARSSSRWPDRAAGAPALMPDDLHQRVAALQPPRECLAALAEPVVAQACAASLEAIDDAGLSWRDLDLDRVGCVIGTSKGGVRSFEQLCRQAEAANGRGIGFQPVESSREFDRLEAYPTNAALPFSWVLAWPDGAATVVASMLGIRGPVLAPVTACATGLSSIVRGVELIRDNVCDVVIAGSSDASLTPAMLASFRRLGVLAKSFDDPATAVRPFDRHRSGFLIGEGAGVFVLEATTHAQARQRRGYAQWLGGGGLSDAAGLTQLSNEPDTLVRLIHDSLRRSNVGAGELDVISLHGTATPSNDQLEARAIRTALGTAADRVSCFSLKGAIGHLLGAAGSVEFAALLLAMRDGTVPPTVNLTEPDSGFDLDFVTGQSKSRRVDVAMKLSLGFGGHLVAGVVGRV